MTIFILLTPLHPCIVILLTPLHPCIVILLTRLHPIHFHSPYTIYTPSANSSRTSCYGLSGSTPSAILLVHLVMARPGLHLQPYYWYIFSWHVRVYIFSHIIGTSCHGMYSSPQSAQQYLSMFFFSVLLATQFLELSRRIPLAYINPCSGAPTLELRKAPRFNRSQHSVP